MESLHNPTKRVIDIIKLIGNEKNLTLTDIALQLDYSKSTIQPILKTLVSMGILNQNTYSKTYDIGIELFKLGQNFLHGNNSFDIIKKSMKEIVSECNEICQMGISDGRNSKYVFYIAKEEPTQSVQLISNIGVSLPAHATALGKCLLSSLTDEQIRELFSSGMEELTKNTITNVDTLILQLNEVRKNKFSIEIEEATEGIECIAVPLIQDNKVIASLSVSAPIFRMNTQKHEQIKQLLLLHKKNIDSILIANPLIL